MCRRRLKLPRPLRLHPRQLLPTITATARGDDYGPGAGAANSLIIDLTAPEIILAILERVAGPPHFWRQSLRYEFIIGCTVYRQDPVDLLL